MLCSVNVREVGRVMGRSRGCSPSSGFCHPFFPSRPVSTDRGEGCVLTERHGTIKVHEKVDMIVYAYDPSSGEAEAEGSQV